VEANARTKLEAKRVDLVAGNRVGVPGSGFESDHNALTVVGNGFVRELGPASKDELAAILVDLIAERL
jgi:phosphopantothenoylcysteine decarboxylase/phosphopantothenate--cysteine ligase